MVLRFYQGCRKSFSTAGAIRPRTRGPSTSADGFICSVDDIFSSAEAALSRVDDKFWRERVLSRPGKGKFCTVAAKCRFGDGLQSPSKGNVYRADARICADPPISRFSGVNKTVGGANRTVDRVEQTIAGANRTVDRAIQTVDRATQTIDRAIQTIDRVNQTIAGATKTVDEAKKTIKEAKRTFDGTNGIVSRRNAGLQPP